MWVRPWARAPSRREFAHLHERLREDTVGWLSDAPDLRPDVDPEAVVVVATAALGGIAYADLDAVLARGLTAS